MKTSISFLNSSYSFEKTIELINKSSCDLIHVDVMDGLFVNNKITFNKDMLNVLKESKKSKDVHLMTLHIKQYIDVFSYINPEYITFSYEAVSNIEEIINYIKEKNIKVGIAINPLTDINVLKPFINDIDLVLVMSVIPGYGGQKFISSTTKKVSDLVSLRTKKNAKFIINVDGGINDTTIKCFNKGDLDMAVLGSYVCCSGDFNSQIKKIFN